MRRPAGCVRLSLWNRPGGPTDRPTRDDVAPGTTVTVVQERQNDSREPLVGDVRRVVTDELSRPGGVLEESESGATGRVKAMGEEGVEG